MLLFRGTVNDIPPAALETIKQNAQAARVETVTIDGANHIYAGHAAQAAAAIASWLETLS